jgi:hypothetical protein
MTNLAGYDPWCVTAPDRYTFNERTDDLEHVGMTDLDLANASLVAPGSVRHPAGRRAA